MKDKELNEKESLELIARMIRNTRRNLDTGSGNSFLVWGYVGVLVTLAVWAGVTFTGNPVWMWGFWGIPVVGYLLMFLLLRKRQKTVKFYLDKILERVWGGVRDGMYDGGAGGNGCRTLRNYSAFVCHLLLVGQHHYGLHHSLYYVFYLPAVWLFMGAEEFVVYLGRSAFPLIPALVCRCTGIFADYSRAYTEL